MVILPAHSLGTLADDSVESLNSNEELKARLYARQSESREVIAQRLSWAEKEMALAPRYNYHIVNDHLKTAYDVLRAILIAEEHKNR